MSWGRLIITHSSVPSSCPSSSDCISGRCPIRGRFFEPSSGLDCWCHHRQRARLSGNTDISRQSDRKLALPTLAHRAVDDLCYDVPEFPQLACGAVLDCCRVRRNLRAGELLRGAGARRTHGWSGGLGLRPRGVPTVSVYRAMWLRSRFRVNLPQEMRRNLWAVCQGCLSGGAVS